MEALFSVYFDKGYIADPYWPELYRLIDIQKMSGMNRARSTANRRKALDEYLSANGMTLEDYKKLEVLSQRPFYTDDAGKIIIPKNQVESSMVATCDTIRSASRPCPPDQVRSRFDMQPWQTQKDHSDDIWERFVIVSAGTGQKLSNQRALRRSHYIEKFEATGLLSFDPEFVDPKTLKNAFEWGGQHVGIGASRKMGWGRYSLKSWSVS